MKASKELVKHLSACLWYANEESISQILESFGGNPLDENPSTKHPIELVNECYPNGWCVEKCDEVIKDINSFYGATFLGECNFYGQIYRSYFASNSSWEIIITRSEYMAITRPQQRDYTGVRYKTIYDNVNTFELWKKEGNCYRSRLITDNHLGRLLSVDEINNEFKSGFWIEVSNEEEWKPKVGELVEIYGDNESDGGFKGEYSHTTEDGYHYIKTNDVIGSKNIRPVSNGVHVEQPKPEPTQRIESLEKSRKELFTNQSNIFSRLAHLESLELAHAIATLKDCVNDLDSRLKQLEAMQVPTLNIHL